ncbi:MAG: septum formation protein Maf [Proteobacteria bacterium]|nr:septum formation protein Maf [Pseudomonadota bacterium]MBU1640928.1 septum formation protein Maf [Pseudomonadota bacterium]
MLVRKAVFNTLRPLILASGSPRRRDFLSELGLQFLVQTTDVDESGWPGEAPEAFVRRLALEKAWAVATHHPEHVILGADTVVVRDGCLLGKPSNRREAEEILASLAGRWHEVWTGFALCCQQPHLEQVGAVVTRVRFADLDPAVIAAYAASGDGDDKAGAYGIQSGGAFLVSEISGSYTNVIGLPVAEVVAALHKIGVLEVAG